MENDWRLFREQDKYLHGVVLVKRNYRPGNVGNDHDHCEFCMAKFGNGSNALDHGYSTEDGAVWVCAQCFDDFKDKFEWIIALKND